ncbi:MAG: DUF2207 domain-containing protein [Saprospiraceae bacterium]
MKHLLFVIISLFYLPLIISQEAFIIKKYDVRLHVTRDAVIKVTETIDLEFTESRHGIIRKIPVRYDAPNGGIADRPYKSGGSEIQVFLTNIEVENWNYLIENEYYNKSIRIGSEAEKVKGAQRYVIHYDVYNAINFFENESELYWNVIGTEWNTQIEKASFNLTWDGNLPLDFQPRFFVATGNYGSERQDAEMQFANNRQSFSGKTTQTLQPNEGMTIGFSFPKDFLQLTPIPPQVMAGKFYFKNQLINIKILANGVSEITETYTVVPVRKMNSISRLLYPFIKNQAPQVNDWLGGEYRYILDNVEVKGAKRCRAGRSYNICFDISDLPVGEERTIELKYLVYDNFYKDQLTPQGSQTYAYIPINNGINEPVLQHKIQIEFPGNNIQNIDFEPFIQGNTEKRPIKVRTLGNTFIADLAAEQTTLHPDEDLLFTLNIPDSYFAEKTNHYNFRLFWLNNRLLLLPVIIFLALYYSWQRWGRDEDFSVMVEYYPPADLPPSEAGILIDDQLHDRDLLALIPYWGARGIIEVRETGTESIFKKDEYYFTKKQNLPADAPQYEKTFFYGIFGKNGEIGKEVKLSSLKNQFYTTMQSARIELENRIKQRSLYVPYTRGAGTALKIIGLVVGVLGIALFAITLLGVEDLASRELGFGLFASGALALIFGIKMPKKAPIGLNAYKKLAGFELFVKDAELPRLETFIKEDPHYFDKTLPYAIVFNQVEKWAEKFKDLTLPEPDWYHSSRRDTFSPVLFTNSLSHSMRSMGSTFVSQPSSSGSSGSSFGGGGFSGGGFGGGGGSSW